jgi:hypothetical protein
MSDTKINNAPTFERGDRFSIVLRVSDSSGVTRVDIRFRNDSDESVKSIHRSVTLEGETEATAEIEFQVDEDLPPGDYVCEYVALTDQKGNQSLIAAPGIEFRVEGDMEEHRGPVLLDWSIA